MATPYSEYRRAKNMTRRPTPVIAWFVGAIAILFACGCSTTAYRPEFVKQTPFTSEQHLEGKALVYMERADSNYVYKGLSHTLKEPGAILAAPVGVMTSRGSLGVLTFPLGSMTKEIAKTVLEDMFTGGAETSTSLQDAQGYRAVFQPRITNFSYGYHEVEHLGFAVTPDIEMTLAMKVLSPEGVPLWEKTYSSGRVKGARYVVSFKPEDRLSRLAHQVLYDLMRQAALDAKDFLASRSATAHVAGGNGSTCWWRPLVDGSNGGCA